MSIQIWKLFGMKKWKKILEESWRYLIINIHFMRYGDYFFRTFPTFWKYHCQRLVEIKNTEGADRNNIILDNPQSLFIPVYPRLFKTVQSLLITDGHTEQTVTKAIL